MAYRDMTEIQAAGSVLEKPCCRPSDGKDVALRRTLQQKEMRQSLSVRTRRKASKKREGRGLI